MAEDDRDIDDIDENQRQIQKFRRRNGRNIPVSNDVYAYLTDLAQSSGLSTREFVEQIIRQYLTSSVLNLQHHEYLIEMLKKSESEFEELLQQLPNNLTPMGIKTVVIIAHKLARHHILYNNLLSETLAISNISRHLASDKPITDLTTDQIKEYVDESKLSTQQLQTQLATITANQEYLKNEIMRLTQNKSDAEERYRRVIDLVIDKTLNSFLEKLEKAEDPSVKQELLGKMMMQVMNMVYSAISAFNPSAATTTTSANVKSFADKL